MWTTEAAAESRATPEQIWQHYVDVSNWTRWDHAIERSTLDGPFAVGTRGMLKPKGAPASVFETTWVESGRGFGDRTVMPHPRLPLAAIEFDHRLTPMAVGTRITHTVRIHGFLGPVVARLLGSRLATELLVAVQTLAILADDAAISYHHANVQSAQSQAT